MSWVQVCIYIHRDKRFSGSRVLCSCLKGDISFQRKSQLNAGVITTHSIQVNAVIRENIQSRIWMHTAWKIGHQSFDSFGIVKHGSISLQLYVSSTRHCADTVFSEQESPLFDGQFQRPAALLRVFTPSRIQTFVWVILSFSSRSIQASSNVKSCCI